MKKYLLPLFAAFAFTVGTAAAQTTTTTTDAGAMQGRGNGRQQGSPDEMAKRQSERMTQELGLNADQTAKVQQILLARGQEMQSMRGQGGGDRSQMREQMQTSRAKYDAQFKDVLTADQYTKYTAMEADRTNRGGGRGMGGPGADAGIEKAKAKTVDGDKLKIKEDKIKMKQAKANAKAEKVKVKAD
jgi:hypothetical protein